MAGSNVGRSGNPRAAGSGKSSPISGAIGKELNTYWDNRCAAAGTMGPGEPPNEPLTTHPSGATSSRNPFPMHYFQLSLLQRGAHRFALGETNHGRGNWKRCFGQDRADLAFIRDRYDHAMIHLKKLGEMAGDDHIGAILWFLAFADEVEKHGLCWHEILKVVTPEEEEDHIQFVHRFYRPQI